MRTAIPAVLFLTACGDQADPSPSGTHHRYVVSRELVPTTYDEARDYGLDLNGDETIDNQLGMVLSTGASHGLRFQGASDRSVDRGAAPLLIDVQWPDGAAGPAGFATYLGASPNPLPCLDPTDSVCRRHLQGDGRFDVAADPERPPALVGWVSDQPFETLSGDLTISIGFLGRPVELHLHRARARITNHTATTLTGSIGGGLSRAEIEATFFPALVSFLTDVVRSDCVDLNDPPGCGCAPSVNQSGGRFWLGLFDTGERNCVITVDEFAKNALTVSLFAADISEEGIGYLSVGIGFEAVSAEFTP